MTEYETRTIDGRPVIVSERPVAVRSSGWFSWFVLLALVVAAVIAAFAFGLIRIDQTSQGSMPKVETSGGSLPGFNVDTAMVEVGTKAKSVDVPSVTVGTEQTTVEVPTIHVEATGNPDARN
jgi:hypothetical protein